MGLKRIQTQKRRSTEATWQGEHDDKKENLVSGLVFKRDEMFFIKGKKCRCRKAPAFLSSLKKD